MKHVRFNEEDNEYFDSFMNDDDVLNSDSA